MDCKEIQRWIPDFIKDKLDDKELEIFMEHIQECPECKEELTIQFLVAVGMESLEEGNTFDLQRELNDKMELAESKLRFRRIIKTAAIAFELLIVGVLIILAMVVFL